MKKYIYSFLLGATLLGATSCFKKQGIETTFEGALVEFNVTPTTTAAKTYARVANGLPILDSVRINLIAAQRATPVSVTYDIDNTAPAAGSPANAIAGVHYSLVSSKTVLIPANSSFVYVKFNVFDDALLPGDKFNLTFKIISADLPVAENYRSITIPLGVICPYSRAFFVGLYNCEEPGYTPFPYPVNFAATVGNANGITTDNFWDFGMAVNYVLSGATNSVNIPVQNNVIDGGGTPRTVRTTVGSSTSAINTCSGTIIAPFQVLSAAGAVQDNNTHTYKR